MGYMGTLFHNFSVNLKLFYNKKFIKDSVQHTIKNYETYEEK